MKLRLFTPGPSTIPTEYLLESARPLLHHRSADVEAMHITNQEVLKSVVGTSQPVYSFISSGTGAMESAIDSSFDDGQKVLALDNGYFGERFADICKRRNLNVIEYKVPWSDVFDLNKIEDIIKENPDLAGITMVYSETSTGRLNDIRPILDLCRERNIITVVDAISGVLTNEYHMDSWAADVTVLASHKGFLCPPGLAFVAYSEKHSHLSGEGVSYYLSKLRMDKFFPTTHTSGAVSLIRALSASLADISELGVDNVVRRNSRNAAFFRRAATEIGFTLFVEESGCTNAVTTLLVPEGHDVATIKNTLKNFGITVAGGQGDYKTKFFRIGHIGFRGIDEIDLIGLTVLLESVINPNTTSKVTRSFMEEVLS